MSRGVSGMGPSARRTGVKSTVDLLAIFSVINPEREVERWSRRKRLPYPLLVNIDYS